MAYKITTDHEEIKGWVKERGGSPATFHNEEVEGEEEIAVLFEKPGHGITEISWDEFFDHFENSKLAFRYNPEKSATPDFSFIDREHLPTSALSKTEPVDNDELIRENTFPSIPNESKGI